MHGWMGKILNVNLNTSEITESSTQEYIEKYLGGRGIASRIYLEKVRPEIKAFDSGNYLIFMTGPLVATGAQGATRMSIVGKSPMAYPEKYSYGNLGGLFPAELKKTGYDGVVITGRAANPVYLSIQDNKTELNDASSLWGQGAYRTGEMIVKAHGHKARAILHPMVQPIGELDVDMPRSSVVYALLDPMEPRMSRPIAHAGFARAAWMFNMMDPGSNPVTTGVFREITRAFWGGAEAADLSSYKGKALAAVKIQNRNYVEDSLGLCDFAWPLTYSFSKPGVVGDPDLEGKIFTAVTGHDNEGIDQCAERIVLVQRAIQVREGRELPKDDYPPEINFTEPLKPVGPSMVPGPGDEPVNVAGKVLDRDKFTSILKEYYRLRGWSEETGLPLPKTLSALGVNDLF